MTALNITRHQWDLRYQSKSVSLSIFNFSSVYIGFLQ